MAAPQPHGAVRQHALTQAAILRTLALELETLADRVDAPSRCVLRADELIAEGERISEAVRAVFRGRR